MLLNNIQYRLNSGRAQYVRNGGKLGRKQGSTKTEEQKREEYKEVLTLLRKGYSIRNTAKLTGVSVSTVQRVKKEFLKEDWSEIMEKQLYGCFSFLVYRLWMMRNRNRRVDWSLATAVIWTDAAESVMRYHSTWGYGVKFGKNKCHATKVAA